MNRHTTDFPDYVRFEIKNFLFSIIMSEISTVVVDYEKGIVVK